MMIQEKSYKKLCSWFNEELLNSIKEVQDNELKYLYSTAEFIRNKFDKTMDRLNSIDLEHNKELTEFICDMKICYKFMKQRNNHQKYQYYNKIFSWYELNLNLLNSMIDNLINNNTLKEQDIDIED